MLHTALTIVSGIDAIFNVVMLVQVVVGEAVLIYWLIRGLVRLFWRPTRRPLVGYRNPPGRIKRMGGHC